MALFKPVKCMAILTQNVSKRCYRARFARHKKFANRVRSMPKSLYNKIRTGMPKETPMMLSQEVKDLENKMYSNDEMINDSDVILNENDILYRYENQNISEIANNFFIKHFLNAFNHAKNTNELLICLDDLKGIISDKKTQTINDQTNILSNISNELLTLGYHNMMGRSLHHFFDIEFIGKLFNELKERNLLSCESYTLMLNAYTKHCNNDNNISDKIEVLFKEFLDWININDPIKPSIIIADSVLHQSYLEDQNNKYSEPLSIYLNHLFNNYLDTSYNELNDDNTTNKLIEMVHLFYDFLERGVIPSQDSSIKMIELIGNNINNRELRTTELSRIFRIIVSCMIKTPSISFFNGYLRILAKYGNFEESLSVLKLLLFTTNLDNLTLPFDNRPTPTVDTFFEMFNCLKIANENGYYDQDYSAKKSEYVLKQMKNLKIGASKELYTLVYEITGVAFWDQMSWHLRMHNRP